MNILVAGGTGVLGKRTVSLLIEQGHQVGVITRSQEKSQWIEAQGATAHQVDIFDNKQMEAIAKGYEGIIHLATAIPRATKTNPADWEMNTRLRLDGTDVLLQAAVVNDMRFYIQESYIGIYGHHGDNIITEQTPVKIPVQTKEAISPQFRKVFDSLITMEQKVQSVYEEHGVATIILRFGIIYSYDSTNIPALANGQFPVVDKTAYWSLVSADDASQAIVAAVNSYETNAGKVFNIVDDAPVKAAEMLNYSAQYIGKKKASRVPKFLVKLLLGKFALNYMTTSQKVDNTTAKRELKWIPEYATYKEGIPVEIERWKLHGSS